MRGQIQFLFSILLLLLMVQMANVMSENALLAFGIYPRDLEKLPHVLTAPFIHANWKHFLHNCVSLTIFTVLCLVLRDRKFFLRVSAIIILMSGVMVWLFGRDGLHVGASAWIFGLWSLCIVTAFFDRSFLNIIVALTTILAFGSMVTGLIPFEARISFEGHVFGAFSGLFAAWFSVKKRPRARPAA